MSTSNACIKGAIKSSFGDVPSILAPQYLTAPLCQGQVLLYFAPKLDPVLQNSQINNLVTGSEIMAF